MNAKELAKMIDHTLLSPYAHEDDLRAHCEVAKKYGFKTVAINNAVIPLCKELLKDSDVLCDAAVASRWGSALWRQRYSKPWMPLKRVPVKWTMLQIW